MNLSCYSILFTCICIISELFFGSALSCMISCTLFRPWMRIPIDPWSIFRTPDNNDVPCLWRRRWPRIGCSSQSHDCPYLQNHHIRATTSSLTSLPSLQSNSSGLMLRQSIYLPGTVIPATLGIEPFINPPPRVGYLPFCSTASQQLLI